MAARCGILLLLVSSPLAAQQVSMFRNGPAHPGVYAGELPAAKPSVLWKFSTHSSVFFSPAVADGMVYIGSNDGGLYALNARDGTPRWRFATAARIPSSPAVAGGAVYFSSYDGHVYAVDLAGNERWRFATGGEHRFAARGMHGATPENEMHPDPYDYLLSSPAVSGGLVYVGSSDGFVYALDARTGTVNWKFQTGDVVHGSPAVADGMVFIGSWDSYLYALDAGSGELRWRFGTRVDPEIHNQQGFSSSATIVNGIVYVGCRDGHLYAVDERTGQKRWDFNTGGAWVTSAPAVSAGVVYFGTGSDFRFIALDALTGKQVFINQFERPIFSSPSIAGNHVVIASMDGKLSNFTIPDGKPVWVFQTPEAAAASAAYVNSLKALASDSLNRDAPFYDNMVFRANNQLTLSFMSSPVLADGVLYIGSVDGNVYALK